MNDESRRLSYELGSLFGFVWQLSVHQVIPDGIHLAQHRHYWGNFLTVSAY